MRHEDDPADYVQSVIDSWRAQGRPNAKSALQQRPDLQFEKTMVLDLIYEEYCLRREQGEQLAASTFFEDFPTLRFSIVDMLDVHDELDANPSLAAKLAPPKVDWPDVGDSFRGYEIIRLIGQGSLARVYLASNPDLGPRFVALKVSRNLQEAATAGRLDHENVMDVNWVAEDESRNATWMCMPYCGMATVRDVLDVGFAGKSIPDNGSIVLTAARRFGDSAQATEQREPAAAITQGSYVEACLHLGRQLADALQHAHDRKILHRDLKPTNILITTSGSAKLLDFNLSADPHVDAQRLGGTLGYMAPEHINATFHFPGNAQVDCRSEVYALGVILYELMTGRLPFGKPDLSEGSHHAAEMMAFRQSKWRPIAPSRSNPRINSDVEKVLLRALEKDPGQRFANAAEMGRALQRCQQRLESQRVHKNRNERRCVAAAGLLGLILVVLGVLVSHDAATSESVATRRGKAERYIRSGQVRKAKYLLERIPDGEYTEYDHEMMLYCHLCSGDSLRAAIQGELLLRYDKNNHVYLNNYARALINTDPQLGYTMMCRAIGLAPNCPQVCRNYAELPVPIYFNMNGKISTEQSLDAVEAALDFDNKVYGLHAAGSVYAAIENDNLLAFEYAMRAVELGQHTSLYQHPMFRRLFDPAQLRTLKRAKGPITNYTINDYVIQPSRRNAAALARAR